MITVDPGVKDQLPTLCSKFPQERHSDIKELPLKLSTNPDAKAFLDRAGIKIASDFTSVSNDSQELDVPHLVMAGQEHKRLADKSNCFRRGGWGANTKHMNFRSGTPPVMKTLLVTHADDGRRASVAREWAKALQHDLKSANAPFLIKDFIYLAVSQ